MYMAVTVLCMVGFVFMGFNVLIAMAIQPTEQPQSQGAPKPYYTYKNGVYTRVTEAELEQWWDDNEYGDDPRYEDV